MGNPSEAKEYPGKALAQIGRSHLETLPPVIKKVEQEAVVKVPDKVQKKIAKKVAACISAGIVASTGGFIALGETGHLPEQTQQWYDSSASHIRAVFGIEELKGKPAETITQETKSPETTSIYTVQETTPQTIKITPETTEVIVNTPEIAGLTFNQETKSYFNEAGEVVGILTENAVKINGEMSSAIGLKPEAINKILEENRQKGIFKCPWPFDWQKDKGIEIVELIYKQSEKQETFEKHGIYPPDIIGIKYSGPINLYSPFDALDSQNAIFENLPDKKDSNFFSNQPYKNLSLTTNFSYKSEIITNEIFGSLQYNFIDWESFVSLSKPEKAGDQGYLQNILDKIKCGVLLGKILPGISGFGFLDYSNNENFFENPGKFQGNIAVMDFNDDFTKDSSSLEKMLKYTNKAGQEFPIYVWSK
jgi:hypothetical protein